MEGKTITVAMGKNFNLERAVCNHGFFMMAPNLWVPSEKTLIRPLRLNDNVIVTISIIQSPHKSFLLITVIQYLPHQQLIRLSTQEWQTILARVTRMLRLSEEDGRMVEEFHRVHPEAKKVGFAHIFRSPTLFEDIVKSVLLCNCTWSRSLKMAQDLCDLQRKISNKGSKRKRSNTTTVNYFPSPKDIARLDVETLNKHCNLGYRASTILQLAQSIANGSLNLGDYEDHIVTRHELFQRLMKIKGFGPFTIANIKMCIGIYQEIPVDTETIKHFKEIHGMSKINKKNQTEIIEQIYGNYAPFQCLAYWMEHVQYYEKMLGKLSDLPRTQYCKVSTTNFGTGNVGNK